MPQVGEIKKSVELGYKRKNKSIKHFWAICESCGKGRWVEYRKDRPAPVFCKFCAIKEVALQRGNNVRGLHWKGGKSKASHGYMMIYLYSDDPFFSMADKKHLVYEHRLVMAKSLGRCLDKAEIVHHKNGIRTDNKIENLELYSGGGNHSSMHNQGYQDGFKKGYLDGKNKRARELELYIQKLEIGGVSG